MRTLAILLLFVPFIGHSQQIHEQIVTSNIDAVKLYLTAGQMTHNQPIDLKQGRNRLVFSGISAYADPQSIQFSSDGAYNIVSVSTEMDFLAAEEFNPRISVLKDSLENLRDDKIDVEDILGAYRAEQDVLKINRDLGGNSQNLTVDNIREAADFYRTRTLEINKEITKLNKRKRKLTKAIEDTRFQLVELNYDENQRSNQVIVLLDVPKTHTVQSSLNYLVTDCGWAATYDLSAADLQQKINLKYKAQVYNNTGNSWKDVDLMLSTGDPHLSASHPELSPWLLSYYGGEGFLSSGRSNAYVAPSVIQAEYRDDAISNINEANRRAYDNYYVTNEQDEADNLFNFNANILVQDQTVSNPQAQFEQIEISELSTEFVIEAKFSCPSDAKPYMVNVKEHELEATFSHVSVPKMDRSAFLLAHIVGWQDLDLIPGPTHVYFGGTYVGMSSIDIRNVSDTLSLSFGRDDQVVVMRKLKTEMSTKRVLGSTKKEAYMYEMVIRNNRDVPISITVYDQVPISRSNEIDVIVDELSEGVQDEATGEVTWRMVIPATGVQGRKLGYTVKYPKNAQITMKKFRTVSSPSF
ncbi:MAG: DUF4139 domain-containing protein [Crocinitomicaceae bacterium]|nr:DUF4139 domain-containing protein [Crocinitomicaceae bacterium]